MADEPSQRITRRCSPQRSDETYHDYVVRFKAHRDACRQQILDDYYNPTKAGLPSPDSESGLDEEDRATLVAHIESDIRIENGRPEPGDLPIHPQYPRAEGTFGKSLSEISDYDDGYRPARRPEDREYDYYDYNGEESSISEGSPSPRKRSESAAEDDALEPPAKRCRLDTTSGVPPPGPSTSANKRKRLRFEEPQAARDQEQAGPKKRKTDTHSRPAPDSATSNSKRKRASEPDEACDSDEHTSDSPSGRRALGAKKRKVVEETGTNNSAVGRDCNRIPRVTRARRRQLSEKDAQLFQLGDRGQLDLQVQAHKTQGQAMEAAAGRSGRQQSSATTNNNAKPRRKASNVKPKASNVKPKASNTSIGPNTRATANTSNDTKSRAKVPAGDTSTVTSAGTKARRGRSKRQP